MSRTKSAFLGTISSQVYAVIAILISLFSLPIIVHHLNPEIYGLSIIIFQITSYLGLFDFGLTAGVERYLAGTKTDSSENREIVKKIICTSLVVYIIFALCILLSGSIFAIYSNHLFKVPAKYDVRYIVMVVSIVLALQTILRAITGIFFAHQRQLLSNTLSFVLNFSNSVIVVVLVLLDYGLWSFAYAQVIVFIITAVLNLYYFRKYYSYVEFNLKYYDFKLIKEMFKYGYSVFMIGVSAQIIFQTDRILVGYFVSLTAVTIYSVTTRLPELTTQFLWKITDNAFPGIVETVKNNKQALIKIHDDLMNITISLSVMAFWYIAVVSQPFIKLWVGESYFVGNIFLFSITYLYLIQHTVIHVTAMCLSAAGIVKRLSVVYFIEAMLNIVISIILVKKYGTLGVIYGTIISGLITSAWFTPFLAINYMQSTLIKYLYAIVKPLTVATVTGFILYLIFDKLFIGVNGWLMLILYSLVFLILSALPFVYFNKQLIQSLLNKVKNN